MSEERVPDKVDADIILCMHYLRFIKKHHRKPQVIRVAPDILVLLVPTAERRSISFFGAEVILDETLKGTVECQWKL